MESGPPRNGVRGPYFLLTFLFISPHPLIYERGELNHLNERKNLLHICKHVELVNYPFKKKYPGQVARGGSLEETPVGLDEVM